MQNLRKPPTLCEASWRGRQKRPNVILTFKELPVYWEVISSECAVTAQKEDCSDLVNTKYRRCVDRASWRLLCMRKLGGLPREVVFKLR